MPTCKFTKKKLFHTSSFMYVAFIFSQHITITLSKEALKVCRHNFLQEIFKQKGVLLVIYLFNYDSYKPTFLMLHMAFDVVLSTGFVK